MTQQVIKAVMVTQSVDAGTDPASISLHFEATGSNATMNITDLLDELVQFTNTANNSSTHPIAWYLAAELNYGVAQAQWELYDATAHLAGGSLGSPIAIRQFQLNGGTAGNTQSMPAGCACAFGYRADYGSDVEFGSHTRPRARDRNRFYLGPLNMNAMTWDSTTGRAKLHPTFRDNVLKNIKYIADHNDGMVDQRDLVVWSKVGAFVKSASSAYSDDRIDYQRRRSDPTPLSRVALALH